MVMLAAILVEMRVKELYLKHHDDKVTLISKTMCICLNKWPHGSDSVHVLTLLC